MSAPRAWLVALLAILTLAVSAAPCTGFAAPVRGPSVSAPQDPCRSAHLAPAACCAQLACQSALAPPAAAPVPPPAFERLAFSNPDRIHFGRGEPPPTPPPRPSMS